MRWSRACGLCWDWCEARRWRCIVGGLKRSLSCDIGPLVSADLFDLDGVRMAEVAKLALRYPLNTEHFAHSALTKLLAALQVVP
jgi:hypothetical protein